MRVEPYREANERSQKAKMARAGSEPKSLAALVRWFRAELAAEAPPLRLHARGVHWDAATDDDAGGGSRLGSPAQHPAFVAWLTAHPMETDPEDYYRRPLRAAIFLVGRRNAIRGRLLERLAATGGDWAAVDVCDCDCAFSADAATYWEQALRVVWREFSTLRVDRPRRDDQEAA